MNDLNENTLNPNCFEKTKAGWGNFKNFSLTMFNRSSTVVLAANSGISISKIGLN